MEHKYNAKQEESILPTQYLPWKEVFEQKAAERFPGKRPWDHAIELRDDFKPKKGKIYPLNPLQQNTLDEWIKEQLAKGYIRANSYVLWITKFTRHISINDGRLFQGYDRRRMDRHC
jgi:hypothetical protein